MQDEVLINIPFQYENILNATKESGFTMASDLYTGSLLKTLVSSKPGASILELGTGSGLASSWILEGMDKNARLLTIDNNELLMSIAKQNLKDERIDFVCTDGYKWIVEYQGPPFDFIFADAMPGKYDLFEETWALLKNGGFYIIDDMIPQPNWPVGHAEKVEKFIKELESRKDLILTKLNWSTGIIMVVKILNK
jgi:predicted O-methyltransferase YrrM